MRRERSYCHWYGGSGGCYISVARVCGTSSVPIKTTPTTHKSLSSKHAKAKNEKNMCVCNVQESKWRKTKRNTAIKTLPPIIHPLKMAEQYTQGIQGSKEEGIAEILRYSCIKLKTKHHSYQFSKRTALLPGPLQQTEPHQSGITSLGLEYKNHVKYAYVRWPKKAVMFVAKNIQNTQTHIFWKR